MEATMKATDKPKALQAFTERLTQTFNSLDGREAEQLLRRLNREITRQESWKAGKTGIPVMDAMVDALKATKS
jgi:deoxyribodipyrimidine photolyase